MDSFIFSLIEQNRNQTLNVVSQVTEQQADVIPVGFNNNIRWHLGHILTIHERLAFRLIGEPLDLPDELMNLFLNGTRPADWTISPPDLQTLIQRLEEQPERIRTRLQGRLQDELTFPFKEFNRLAEVLVFSIGHEATHNGFMMALKKLL